MAFAPANVIFAGVGVLLWWLTSMQAKTSLSIFSSASKISFRRLEVYTKVTPTPAMTDVMVKIMVEVLDILVTATKEMKQSRAKFFLKKVVGVTNLEDGIKRLDKLTNEEARMANAVVLKVTHIIDEKVMRSVTA